MRLQLGKFTRALSLLVLPMVTSAVASAGVTVTVSSPAAGSTVSSPTTIKASAASGYPITGWYIYVDDKAAWNTGATQTINAAVNIPSGSHKVYVRAWNSTGANGTSSTFYLTGSGSSVAPGGNEPVAPAGAKLIDNIDEQTGWGHCSDCAADPANPNPPIALWSFTQNQNTPSKDGNAAKFWIGGTTAYANALHWKKFGDQSAYKNFIWEFWVYGNADMNNAQNLEFDLFQAVSGRKYMFGTQCNYWKQIWQGWDETTNHWIDMPDVPCPKLPTGQWNRIKWYFQRTSDNRTHYVSVTVNNTTYKVDRYWNSHSTTWGNTFGVQFQQDMNKAAADYTVWADKVKVWMW